MQGLPWGSIINCFCWTGWLVRPPPPAGQVLPSSQHGPASLHSATCCLAPRALSSGTFFSSVGSRAAVGQFGFWSWFMNWGLCDLEQAALTSLGLVIWMSSLGLQELLEKDPRWRAEWYLGWWQHRALCEQTLSWEQEVVGYLLPGSSEQPGN